MRLMAQDDEWNGKTDAGVMYVGEIFYGDEVSLVFVRMICIVIFFFSSRRRHTRCLSDWSSDVCSSDLGGRRIIRSEEHTSELQSLRHLVCRLLLGSEEHTSELQ